MRRLPVDAPPPGGIEVVALHGAAFGGARARAAHRHDYHELLWIRDGHGEHLLDGETVPVVPGAVTLIGRGQVHVFREGAGLHGAVVRFGPETLPPGVGPRGAGGGGWSWLLTGRGGRVVRVPASDADRVDAVIDALAAEAGRPQDAYSAAAQAHLLGLLLLWLERWYDAAHTERPEPAAELHRRFAAVLERDFAAHHDAAHYAQALAVPAAGLSRELAAATGRTTKELILDRVMLEAQRLLRFTDLTVGEVAHVTGFADPLYFSRAFKRHTGLAPQRYREKSMHR